MEMLGKIETLEQTTYPFIFHRRLENPLRPAIRPPGGERQCGK